MRPLALLRTWLPRPSCRLLVWFAISARPRRRPIAIVSANASAAIGEEQEEQEDPQRGIALHFPLRPLSLRHRATPWSSARAIAAAAAVAVALRTHAGGLASTSTSRRIAASIISDERRRDHRRPAIVSDEHAAGARLRLRDHSRARDAIRAHDRAPETDRDHDPHAPRLAPAHAHAPADPKRTMKRKAKSTRQTRRSIETHRAAHTTSGIRIHLLTQCSNRSMACNDHDSAHCQISLVAITAPESVMITQISRDRSRASCRRGRRWN